MASIRYTNGMGLMAFNGHEALGVSIGWSSPRLYCGAFTRCYQVDRIRLRIGIAACLQIAARVNFSKCPCSSKYDFSNMPLFSTNNTVCVCLHWSVSVELGMC